MDRATLDRLAVGGFGEVPATELAGAAAWCSDWCDATGDGRFCILGDVLRAVDQWLNRHEGGGGVPTALRDRISSELMSSLPAVLDAPEPGDGSLLAASLRSEVMPLLLEPESWGEAGW